MALEGAQAAAVGECPEADGGVAAAGQHALVHRRELHAPYSPPVPLQRQRLHQIWQPPHLRQITSLLTYVFRRTPVYGKVEAGGSLLDFKPGEVQRPAKRIRGTRRGSWLTLAVRSCDAVQMRASLGDTASALMSLSCAATAAVARRRGTSAPSALLPSNNFDTSQTCKETTQP